MSQPAAAYSGESRRRVTAAPRIYWDKRHRVFFGKYKVDDRWKNKLVPVNVTTEEDAANWFRLWIQRFEQTGVEPVNHEVRIERKTIRNLAQRWLAWKGEQHKSDRRALSGCKRLIEKWVSPHAISDVDLETELDIGQCTAWIEWLQSSGRAPLTIRNTVQGLRGFLVDVRGKGWVRLRENPLLDPYVKRMLRGTDTIAGKNTIIHLNATEANKLLVCSSPLIPAMRKVRNLIAIATGARMGEIGAWRWQDFDLEAPTPTVRIFRQLQFSAEKGRPVFKEPKRKSHRVMPLHRIARKALRWWKDHGWREHVGRPPAPEDPVFSSPQGQYTLSRSADSFRADLAIAELPIVFDGKHPFTFHASRRTFMSLLEAASVPREIIGALAGHASKGVADRHYIAKNLNRFHDAVCKLPLPDTLPWLPTDQPSTTRHAGAATSPRGP